MIGNKALNKSTRSYVSYDTTAKAPEEGTKFAGMSTGPKKTRLNLRTIYLNISLHGTGEEPENEKQATPIESKETRTNARSITKKERTNPLFHLIETEGTTVSKRSHYPTRNGLEL